MSSSLKKCSYKLIMIGDSSVGKTSVINRFCSEDFNFSLTSTIGIDFKSKELQMKGHAVKLQIWDTAGQERYYNMTKSYFKKVHGVIIVFSLIDQQSFKNIEKWLRMLQNEVGDSVPRILVGSKFDLFEQRTVSTYEAHQIALRYNIPFMEISSKLNYNISEAFQAIVDQVLSREQGGGKQWIGESPKLKLPFLRYDGRCGC